MESTRRNEQIWLAVGSLVIIAVVALASGLVYTKVVLVPFVLAVFLTTVVVPVVDFQVLRCKIPQSLATVLALVIVVAFLSVFGMFLIGAVDAIVTTVGEYTKSFKELSDDIFKRLKDWDIQNWVDYHKILDVVEQQGPAVITQAVGRAPF